MAYVPYTSATRGFVSDKPERKRAGFFRRLANAIYGCLLYTSDAADE